jgi:adenylate cyclase
MSKSLACEVVISEEIFGTGALSPGPLPQTSVDIRGRVEPMTVRTAERAAMLSDIVAAGAMPAATMAAATA